MAKVYAQPKADFTADTVSGCSPLVVQFTDASTDNPTQWKWDLGNGSISANKNPGTVYINPGTYTVKLFVKNARGTDSIAKVDFITVYAKPDVDFISTASEGCMPLNVAFTDQTEAGSGTIAQYIWDFGDGQISTDKDPSHSYTIADTFSVLLTVKNSFGCRQTLQKSNLVTIYPPAIAAFSYNYANACKPPAPVDFTNTSASKSPLKYQWLFGDGGNATQANVNHVYNTAGTFDVQLLATTDMGCSDTITKTITIGSVIADFALPANNCINSDLFFNNTSSPAPVTASWDFGDGDTLNLVNATHNYATAGTYNIKMTADFGACTNTVTKAITVSDKPKISFTSSNPVTCQLPATISFYNNTTGAISYRWLFGDGTTATENNPIHTYTKGGFYTVTLIAFNSNGCSDTVVQKNMVKLGPPQITGIDNVPVTECVPYNLMPKAAIVSPEPVASYLWDFGDGFTSTDSLPAHNYTVGGNYSLKLVVFTASGCSDTMIVQNAVVLGTPAQPKIFESLPDETCASTPLQFTDASTGDITSWLWNFGDGTFSGLQNPVHQYADTGKFTITLNIDSHGCKSSVTYKNPIKIHGPIANFSTGINCNDPLNRIFTDKSTDAKTWSWNFGDGAVSMLQNPIHKYAAPGMYTIKLLVTNDTCSSEYIDSIKIIDEHPSFSYAAQSNNLCRNDSVSFSAINFDPANIGYILWDFGDGTTTGYGTNNATVSHAYKIAGTFTPVLILKDRSGCRDTITNSQLNFNVYGATANFSNPAGTCINGIIPFTDATATDGIHPVTSYTWNFGDGTTASVANAPFQHLYDSAGTYNVKLAVTDSYGCKDSIEKSKAVIITKPIANFALSDSIRCANNKEIFTDSSSGLLLNYNWDFGDGTASNLQSPTHNYTDEGIFTVKLNIIDRFGCADSLIKQNAVTISNPKASFILNDTFSVCPPLFVQPQSTSKNAISTAWDFGDGNTTNITDPAHLYTTAGKYDLTLIVQGYGQCADTAAKTVVIKGPSGEFTYTPFTGCNPTSVSFAATTKNTASLIWDYSDGSTKNSINNFSMHTYVSAGKFLPKLVLIDSSGCQVGVVNKDTIIIAEVKADIKKIITTGCDSSLINFEDSSLAYNNKVNTYQWNFGDGITSTSANPAHYYSSSGNYKVSLHITSDFGCTDSITVPLNVQVNTSPKTFITGQDSICLSSTAIFKASDSNNTAGTVWRWNFGNGNIDTLKNTSYTYNNPGTYNVKVSATNKFGCADTGNHLITVIPPPQVDAGKDSVMCLNQQLILQATGAQSYVWSSTGSLSCFRCAAPVIKPAATTTYYVRGTSAFGCVANDSVTIRVQQPLKVSVSSGDTLCVGETTTLKATGAQLYKWYPPIFLDAPSANETVFHAAKDTTLTYKLIGTDDKNCFSDSAFVTVKVYPIPQITIVQPEVTLNTGTSVKLLTKNSADITKWRWMPPLGLDDPTSSSPVASPKTSLTYTVVGTNEGSCVVRGQVVVTVLCNNANIFMPNTFSPNKDGMNDAFYPRGKGLYGIKSMHIFNRWGQMVFEKYNFNANDESAGWDGTTKGLPANADVYIYMVEVICSNNSIIPVKGNITLIR